MTEELRSSMVVSGALFVLMDGVPRKRRLSVSNLVPKDRTVTVR